MYIGNNGRTETHWNRSLKRPKMLRTYHTLTKVRSQSDVFLLLFLTPKYYRQNKIPFQTLIIFFATQQRFPLVSLGYLWSYFRLLLNTQGTKPFKYFQFRVVVCTFEDFHSFNIISLSCDKGSTHISFEITV